MLQGQVRKTYAFGSVVLTALLVGCSIALIASVLQWNSFTTEDGTVIRFPVEGLKNLKVKRTASLLWSSILVSQSHIVSKNNLLIPCCLSYDS